MHTARSITRNSIFFTGALVIQRIISSVYFWYYSNNLPGGAEDLGRLQFVLSYATLFFIIGDLGLYLVFVREASKKPVEAMRYINAAFAIKIPLFIIAGIATIGSARIFHANTSGLITLAFIWVVLDNIALFLYGALRALQKLQYESIGVLISQLVTVLIGVVSIQLSGDIRFLIYALLVATIINIAFVSFVLLKKFRLRIYPCYDSATVKFLLKSIPSFAAVAIVVKILNTIDIVLLRQFSADYRAVGLYSVPLKIVTALSLTLPTALMGAIYPAFSHLHEKSEEGLRTIFRYTFEYLLAISIPLSVGFFALGDEILRALFRDEYSPAIIPSKIILFSLPFIFLAFPTGNLLNAINRQKRTAISRAFGIIALIGLDIFLIPSFGVVGAAVALLATHILIFASDAYFIRERIAVIGGALARHAAKVILSSIIMYAALEFLSPYAQWYFLILLGCVVYFVALFIFRGINLKFLRHLL